MIFDEALTEAIQQVVDMAVEPLWGTPLCKKEKVLLRTESNDYSFISHYVIQPNKLMWDAKQEIEAYLRTLRVCEIITLAISDPANHIELFTVTSEVYDAEALYRSQCEYITKEYPKRVH